MKKLALLMLAGLTLSACGSAPPQINGNNRVSVGVAVDDSGSSETATKTVTPADPVKGTPAQVKWTITPGEGVKFTFMTRPGSDAAYITGYRILEEVLSTVDGTSTTKSGDINKMDLYLTSGYNCASRTALQSCPFQGSDTVAANGIPGTHNIYFEGGLGSLVVATDAGVSLVTAIEFYGKASNGAPFTVRADNIISRGLRQGDQ